VPTGWIVRRTYHASLVAGARASFADMPATAPRKRERLDLRVFGSAGSPLKIIATAGDGYTTVRGAIALVPATKRALDRSQLREQLGRLGESPFVLGAIDDAGLAKGLFVPVSELNHLRQQIVEDLSAQLDGVAAGGAASREAAIIEAIADVGSEGGERIADDSFNLIAEVFSEAEARAAADAGATGIVFDPFLRHPAPIPPRVLALAHELGERGVGLRLRTPTIVRPEERRKLDRWLALGLPLLSGHVGLVAELARAGRDVVADYGVNCFNQHTAAELFSVGTRRITLSVELTTEEITAVGGPGNGAGFEVVAYGRPEGMTIEHCVLSAAFDRTPTTCRDLCVRDHPDVRLTDPAGYEFAVATDAACRNRLLHSRPIESSEFLPKLWRSGIRSYRLLFNVPGDPVTDVVSRYREALEAVARGDRVDVARVRQVVGGSFTRGHFARAV
jgi:putative protease